MENWKIEEVLSECSDEIAKWRAAGLSRKQVAEKLTSVSGRKCTEYVIQKVLLKLGLNSKVKRSRPVAINDHSEKVEEQPIEELIQERIKSTQNKIARSKKNKKTLELPPEPIGIFLIGDPHTDNDGCDFATLYSHVKMCQEAEGVVAACVGDMNDNWVGRLARCYANSSVTASDGWRLSLWLLESMQFIALVGGNHDAWAHSAGLDPYQWMTERAGVMCYAQDEIRITLKWAQRPDLEPLVWILRHDFKGRSWFHTTHGPLKAGLLDGKCHLLTAGHLHSWGQLSTEHRHGRVFHAVRVRGYKRADSYALSKEFYEQEHGESCLIVIDPEAEEPSRIAIHWNIENGLEYLKFLRQRGKNESS